MKNIRIKPLLYLTEQAPIDSTYVSSDNEYDFTLDFRDFERSIELAKQNAKKKFLDKLNRMVLGKKVTVNASRGYGQPQKDYTINKVIKTSVDWYYNKNVVVLTDENNKEFFLTPGVNIKIEGVSKEPDDKTVQKSKNKTEEVPQEPPKKQSVSDRGIEGATSDEEKSFPAPTQKTGQTPAPGGPPTRPASLEEIKSSLKNNELDSFLKDTIDEDFEFPYTAKMAEKDFYPIFSKFLYTKPGSKKIDIKRYFKGGKHEGDESHWETTAEFEIPDDVIGLQFDPKEFKLEYKNTARHFNMASNFFTEGSVDVVHRGRFWNFKFKKSGGLINPT